MKAYYGVPPSIQAERHSSRQPAADARGQTAQNGQQTKGQAHKQAAGAGVSAVSAVTAVSGVTTGGGAAVSSLGEA